MAKNSKTTIPDGPEIARLMGKGAMYGLILFTIVVVGIWAMWAFGEAFLPRDVSAELKIVEHTRVS